MSSLTLSQHFRNRRGGERGQEAGPVYTWEVVNNSGAALARGDVVVIDRANSTADIIYVTTTTTLNDPDVVGMVWSDAIANGAVGLVQYHGPTAYLKVDGTTDIAKGDLLGTFTTAKIASKATSAAFARALEAYSTNDSNGVIDAFINCMAFVSSVIPGGTLLFADGSAAAPGVAPLSDQDNGLYRIGANNLGIAAGGTKILDIATTGLGVTGTLTVTGQILAADGTVALPGYAFNGSGGANDGFYRYANGGVAAVSDGVATFAMGGSTLRILSTHTLSWSSGDPTSVASDAILARDAAGIIAQRNSTNAQVQRIYNTFTTVTTVGEWFEVDWQTTANTCLIRTNAGSSTGTVRALTIQPATQPTAATAGAAISVVSGASTANVAGALSFTVGSCGGGTNNAAMTFTGGAGGGSSGATGGNASAISVSGAAGGQSTNASGTGGIGSTITLTGGTGGSASGATSSTGGKGGSLSFVAGNGGTITGTTTAIGGAGGDFAITAGNGATATTGSANTAGVGGSVTITAGNAGAAGGNVNGGVITLTPGTATGSGTAGNVVISRGGLVITAGGLTVTAGVATFTAGATLVTTAALTFGEGGNIVAGTSTGTKIGTDAAQKLSIWNAAPIVQPTTGVAAATFAANTSLIANDTATFDGYTIGQVVKALRNIGLLA